MAKPASAEVLMPACAEAAPLMSSGSMMLRQRSTMMPPAHRPDPYINEVRQCLPAAVRRAHCINGETVMIG